MINWLRLLPAAAALTVALCASGVLYLLDVSERARIEQEQRVQIAQQLSGMRAQFEGMLNGVVSSAQVLAATLRVEPGLPQKQLSVLLADLLQHNPSIRNVAIAEGTVIRHAYPLDANRRIVGIDYRNVPGQWPAYRRMMETHQAIIAGPVDLIQHEPGVIVRAPILDDAGYFRGSVSLPIRLHRLLQDVGLDGKPGALALAMRNPAHDEGAAAVFYGDPGLFEVRPVIEKIALPGGSVWEIAAQPAAGWSQARPGLAMLRAVGVAIGLLLALLAYGGVAYLQVRRENERRLGASEARLRQRNLALGATSQGVLLTDAEGRITYVNHAVTQLTGYGRGELVGHALQRLEGPQTSLQAAGLLRERLQRGEPFNGEIQYHRKDGSPFWNDLSITPVLDEQRRASQFVGVLRDISERKQLEQSLQIAATVFEAQEGMMVTDADTIIQRVNKSFTRITGYAPEEVIGKKPDFLQSGKYDAAFYGEMWEQIGRDHYWQGEIWSRRKNGELYLEWLTITAVYGEPGRVTHYVAGFFDITHTKDAEEKIRRLAFYDPLTRLPNRRLLIDRLTQALPSSSRSKMFGALLFIDLDDFKTLNDTRGHDIGDLLLAEVAQRLQSCVRESDTVSRFGGDEFVVMLENVADDEPGAATQAEIIGEKIRAKLGQPYRLHDLEYHSSCSVGLCLFFGQEVSIDELLKRADTAMYQAKRSGRNALRFFDPDMQLALEARLDLNADLRQALKRRQMHLYYQAQVQRDGRPVGAEVLLRWQHPERGLVSPMDFIPLAEESGMILNLGHWVLEHACRQLKQWEHDADSARLKLSVNVSARQFRQPDFVSQVRHALETSGAHPDRLRLELTESIVLEDIEGAIAKMQEIKALGVRFSMDDFGTGYSSLAYLTQLPLDELKIDRSFVRSIGIKHSDSVIVQTIVAMAHTLGIEVIAEGVETAEQRDFLCATGCRLFQGYFYGKPMPLDDFEAMLSAVPGVVPENGPAAPRTPAGQPG